MLKQPPNSWCSNSSLEGSEKAEVSHELQGNKKQCCELSATAMEKPVPVHIESTRQLLGTVCSFLCLWSLPFFSPVMQYHFEGFEFSTQGLRFMRRSCREAFCGLQQVGDVAQMFQGIVWAEHLWRGWQGCEKHNVMHKIVSSALTAAFPFDVLFCFRWMWPQHMLLPCLHFT